MELKKSTQVPEGTIKEPKSQQKKLKNNLDQDKGKVIRKNKSSIPVPKPVDVRDLKKEPKSQQKKLKDNLDQDKRKVIRKNKSSIPVRKPVDVRSLKKVEWRKSKEEKTTAKEVQTSSLKLNEKEKVLEGTRTELQSQQNILNDNLVEKEGKLCREERSHVQVETNLKKVEERNTKLEDEVTQLKESLLAEQKTAKEVQTSSLMGEAIKFGEFQNTILSSVKKKHQKKLISHDVEKLESHQADFETFSSPWKSASKQSKDEKLRDMKQLAENENLGRQYNREIQRIKDLEGMRTELESQQNELKDTLAKEKEKVTRAEGSRSQVVTNLKRVKAKNTKLQEEMRLLNERLRVEEKTTKEAQTSSLMLNERIKDLEDMRTELESQQNELKDTLAQEKDKVTRAEGSRSQVVTNLKKVEEKNTKLEDEVTQLKERLLVEEMTTKEVQTSSLKLNERIKDLEDMRTELESQQKKLKKKLAQEKDKVTRAEGSRVQAENARKTLEQTKAMLEKEKEYLTKLLAAEKRNGTELEKSLAKATTTCEKLQKANEILQKEKEDLSEQQSTEKINTEIQIASFSKMMSHALPGSEKMAQRKDEDSYMCDETQSVITESTDSGRGSMQSQLEYQDSFILNGRQLNTEFKVAVTVASKGANMHIPDTGVELDIPTGATQGKVLIEMIILPFDKLDAPVSTFSCNSSVAVELLPNKMEFQRPVRLTLPHCLKLTKNYQKTKHQVQVYVSHHETGPPIWEEVPNAKYVLDETNCIIFLKSFCWVKYEVNNKIVEAKRIRVYTAGKRLKHTEDSLAETEVGYHWDLPIARENLSVNDNMFVYQSKPFVYVKEGNLPLQIFLTKTVPMQWKYITPMENPKVISFKCVADSKEKSCPFVIEKSEPTDRMPFCMFKVQQGNEDLELYIRFDD